MALSLGLNVQIAGNDALSPNVVVTAQSIPKGESVPMGTTIRLEFADTKAGD